jgi:hypothetical protein
MMPCVKCGLRQCQFCGEPLPPLKWWQKNWLLAPPPFHKQRGTEGRRCRAGLFKLLGIPVEEEQ